MVKSARAKAAEKAAEKAQNDQMYFNIKYPMTNQAVINFGQCRICGVQVEINVPNDVDVLGKHYTTNHQVFDVIVDKGSKIRRVHQERNSLAAEGNCIFLVSIKNFTLKIVLLKVWVLRFFLSVKFATFLLASLAGDKKLLLE